MTDTARIDWRTATAGRALDRIVAEACGWECKLNGYGDHWRLISPNGDYVDEQAHFYDPEDMWLVAPIPAFSTSADAAFTLFASLPDDCTPRLVRMLQPMGDHMGHIWKGRIITNGLDVTVDVIECEADTPALAICRAFLSWKDKGNG